MKQKAEDDLLYIRSATDIDVKQLTLAIYIVQNLDKAKAMMQTTSVAHAKQLETRRDNELQAGRITPTEALAAATLVSGYIAQVFSNKETTKQKQMELDIVREQTKHHQEKTKQQQEKTKQQQEVTKQQAAQRAFSWFSSFRR